MERHQNTWFKVGDEILIGRPRSRQRDQTDCPTAESEVDECVLRLVVECREPLAVPSGKREYRARFAILREDMPDAAGKAPESCYFHPHRRELELLEQAVQDVLELIIEQHASGLLEKYVETLAREDRDDA